MTFAQRTYGNTKRMFYKEHEAVMRMFDGEWSIFIYTLSEEFSVNKGILPVARAVEKSLEDASRTSAAIIDQIIAERAIIDHKKAITNEKRALMREVRSYARIASFLTPNQIAWLERKAERIGQIDIELGLMRKNERI